MLVSIMRGDPGFREHSDWKDKICMASSRSPSELKRDYICTLAPGHDGDHMAHCGEDEICHVWPQEPAIKINLRTLVKEKQV